MHKNSTLVTGFLILASGIAAARTPAADNMPPQLAQQLLEEVTNVLARDAQLIQAHGLADTQVQEEIEHLRDELDHLQRSTKLSTHQQLDHINVIADKLHGKPTAPSAALTRSSFVNDLQALALRVHEKHTEVLAQAQAPRNARLEAYRQKKKTQARKSAAIKGLAGLGASAAIGSWAATFSTESECRKVPFVGNLLVKLKQKLGHFSTSRAELVRVEAAVRRAESEEQWHSMFRPRSQQPDGSTGESSSSYLYEVDGDGEEIPGTRTRALRGSNLADRTRVRIYGTEVDLARGTLYRPGLIATPLRFLHNAVARLREETGLNPVTTAAASVALTLGVQKIAPSINKLKTWFHGKPHPRDVLIKEIAAELGVKPTPENSTPLSAQHTLPALVALLAQHAIRCDQRELVTLARCSAGLSELELQKVFDDLDDSQAQELKAQDIERRIFAIKNQVRPFQVISKATVLTHAARFLALMQDSNAAQNLAHFEGATVLPVMKIEPTGDPKNPIKASMELGAFKLNAHGTTQEQIERKLKMTMYACHIGNIHGIFTPQELAEHKKEAFALALQSVAHGVDVASLSQKEADKYRDQAHHKVQTMERALTASIKSDNKALDAISKYLENHHTIGNLDARALYEILKTL